MGLTLTKSCEVLIDPSLSANRPTPPPQNLPITLGVLVVP